MAETTPACWNGTAMNETLTPLAETESSAWVQSGKVMAEADQLEELIQLKMENPGITREAAMEWALEMRRLYGSSL
jgi:hypothetical protein